MKTNYKKTHIRIFDATGLIFSASPDIDAYDLSRTVLDILQNQNPTEPDFVKLMRQEYADNFDSEYITFDATIESMKYDIEECGLRSLYEIANRLSTNDFTDEFINHYLDVNVPVLGLRGVADDLINAKMLLYAAGETRYADITPEPEFGIIKAKQCLECGSMNTIDAGSGAGCCNACGCWIPDYNNAKRLTGESQ